MLIYTILRARPKTLLCNLRYIERYRDPRKLSSEAGYYLTNLVSLLDVIFIVFVSLFVFLL